MVPSWRRLVSKTTQHAESVAFELTRIMIMDLVNATSPSRSMARARKAFYLWMSHSSPCLDFRLAAVSYDEEVNLIRDDTFAIGWTWQICTHFPFCRRRVDSLKQMLCVSSRSFLGWGWIDMDKNRTLDLHVSGLTSPLIAPIVDIAIHIRRSTKFLLLLRGHRVQSTTITVIVHRSRSGLSSSIALGFVL